MVLDQSVVSVTVVPVLSVVGTRVGDVVGTGAVVMLVGTGVLDVVGTGVVVTVVMTGHALQVKGHFESTPLSHCCCARVGLIMKNCANRVQDWSRSWHTVAAVVVSFA